MAVGAVVVGVAAVGFPLVVGVDGAVRVDELAGAVALAAGGALWAVWLEAAAGLGADADAVADLDVFYVAADADGLAYYFVADAAGLAALAVASEGCKQVL